MGGAIIAPAVPEGHVARTFRGIFTCAGSVLTTIPESFYDHRTSHLPEERGSPVSPPTRCPPSTSPRPPRHRASSTPQPGAWRTFEVTTRVDILKPEGVTRVWLPVPSVDSDWQHSLDNSLCQQRHRPA